MPQLYCQLASRPSPWLLGRTSAGLCTLQTACPLVVTYSGGSPAADTIAAGSAATVYGGSAAAFDASADVWVVLTVPASGALQVVKEADLATVTGDWAGLARLVQHSTEPYQPQAYLGSGGLGGGGTSTLAALLSSTTDRALSLWTGSANASPPAGWQTPAFDDSAWPHAVAATFDTPHFGATSLWSSTLPLADTERCLLRATVTLPAGTITGGSLSLYVDDAFVAVYVNGTLVPGYPPSAFGTAAIPASSLVAGGANVVAIEAANSLPAHAYVQYSLSITYGGSGSVPNPGAASEGDLLYFHSGAWSSLPAGANGDELTLVAGDPAWTAQPADTDTSGTVTSVALAGPTGTTVSGSPVTSSGTLTLSWASQSANTVLGAPNGSSGTPTFRALVGNDIPVDASTIISSAGVIKGNYQAGAGVSISGNTISATGSGGSVTSVALSLPGLFALAGSPITTSGTFAVTLATQAKATVFAGPASGSAAAPTFRALQGTDLPAAAGAGGKIHAHGHFI